MIQDNLQDKHNTINWIFQQIISIVLYEKHPIFFCPKTSAFLLNLWKLHQIVVNRGKIIKAAHKLKKRKTKFNWFFLLKNRNQNLDFFHISFPFFVVFCCHKHRVFDLICLIQEKMRFFLQDILRHYHFCSIHKKICEFLFHVFLITNTNKHRESAWVFLVTLSLLSTWCFALEFVVVFADLWSVFFLTNLSEIN